MLFNSLEFAIFFPVVTALFFILPHRFRWMLLLAASCFFYMFFKPVYILILAFTIVIDYIAGILIENADTPAKKYRFLLLSLFANIGVLAIFKYYNFIGENINALLGVADVSTQIPLLKILLPIGLSFHTFQAMSYTIEVYRGHQKAERHFGIYALYVMFYPQLVAGPIERPQNLLHQFHEQKFFDQARVVSGLQMMLLGLFKKIVIADRLALVVDPVFRNPAEHTSVSVAIACLFYTFQIYCDFSGYSNIAIGSAKVMGFDLMTNFNFPYLGKNVTEFWRRWHISLQTWFNDYVFKPFVLAKRDWGGNTAMVAGLLLTFSISGLWHGAAWTFIAWGALHGLAMSYEVVTKKRRSKLSKKMPALLYNTGSQLLTFCFIIFTFIFFRAHSFRDAGIVLNKLGHIFSGLNLSVIKNELIPYGVLKYQVLMSFFFVGCLILFHGTRVYHYVADNFNSKPTVVRWSVYVGAMLIILICGIFEKTQFIYFQF